MTTTTARMTAMRALLLVLATTSCQTSAFISPAPIKPHSFSTENGNTPRTSFSTATVRNSNNKKEWTSDFDDYIGDDPDEGTFTPSEIFDKGPSQEDVEDDSDDALFRISNILQTATSNQDLSACQARQFFLGQDLQITNFAGSMGFDEVTDWEYYYESEDGKERNVVPPPPLDPSNPKRTRESSGSVVRLFRAEFGGRLGATLRAQGLDARVLLKEFSGTLALQLARAELESIGKLQSQLLVDNNEESMVQTAMARSTLTRQDDGNLCKLLQYLKNAPYTGILGEVNLAELEDDPNFDQNGWYRAFSVPPPKPGSVWIVYEYTGLTTVAAYSQPASVRVARMPLQRGLFGNPVAPPALPPFKERARYIVLGIVKQALEAVATLHEAGIAHRSIGRSSVIIGSVGLDKNEAASPFSTNLARIHVKLADFGFSGRFEESTRDSAFLSRARSFGLNFAKNESSSATTGFAMAEDLHALGFVVLGLLLSTLAEVPTPEYNIPATDEDTLQRLLTDIFDKDMDQFRDYVEAEEIWSNLVTLLDEKEGWEFLESLLFARERAAKDGEILTARGLLSSPFLQRSR